MGNTHKDETMEIENFERENVEQNGVVEPENMNRILPWQKQITIRGLVASVIIGIIYSVIVTKLNLTTGLVPNLNVSAALLAFVFVRTWTKLLSKAGIVSTPFTRQENTIIQTCAVACYSIAVGGEKAKNFLVNFAVKFFFFCLFKTEICDIAGGFGSYLLGLNRKTYEQAGVDTEGNTPGSTKEPQIGWMTGFLFVSCFVGLLALVPLRKVCSFILFRGKDQLLTHSEINY